MLNYCGLGVLCVVGMFVFCFVEILLGVELIVCMNVLCGKVFVGEIISNDLCDVDWVLEWLVIYFWDCLLFEVCVFFYVGEDYSCIFIIIQFEYGFWFKYDYCYEDGELDVLFMYGGEIVDKFIGLWVDFLVDDFFWEMFEEQGYFVLMDNVWLIEVIEDSFIYEFNCFN